MAISTNNFFCSSKLKKGCVFRVIAQKSSVIMNARDQAQAMAEIPGAGSAEQGKTEAPLLQRRVRLRTTICSNVDRSKAAKVGGPGLNG